VLGVQIINGEGKLLNFGGQVIKNVAGYDVSRLLVGSKGRLALVTEVSLKILPQRSAKHYQMEPKPKNKVSSLHLDFEKKLKQIFDPTGVFI
jgi:glycolate oxidase FAD binding subunit